MDPGTIRLRMLLLIPSATMLSAICPIRRPRSWTKRTLVRHYRSPENFLPGQVDYLTFRAMPPSSRTVTSPRFAPRLTPGDQALAFRAVFNSSDAAAARFFGVSRMTIWRWRHDRVRLPKKVAEILATLVQDKLADVLAAQQQLRWFLDRPPPIRRLTGSCACGGRGRRAWPKTWR